MQALRWSRQHQQVYHFSSPLALTLPFCPLPRLSFNLKFSGTSDRSCLQSPPALSGHNGSPYTHFFQGTTQLMSWPNGERYSCPLQPLFLISRIQSSLFSDWRRIVSSKFFDTQVSLDPTEELVSPRHAYCGLFRLRCNGHSLLLSSYLFRIGRIEKPSCSACGHSSQNTSHLILHNPAMDSLRCLLFGDSLSLFDLRSRPWGVARLLRLQGLPQCPHSSMTTIPQKKTSSKSRNKMIIPFSAEMMTLIQRAVIKEKMRLENKQGCCYT